MMGDDYSTDEAVCLVAVYEISVFLPYTRSPADLRGLAGSAPSVVNAVACQKEVEAMQRKEMTFLQAFFKKHAPRIAPDNKNIVSSLKMLLLEL